MPAPTNISPATAIVIGALPYSNTQQVDDAGTTYTVWYAYTAQAGDVEIGIFAFGDLAVYKPTMRVYASDGTTVATPFVEGQNHPAQFPVTPGTLYYFRIATNAGNPTPANLAFSVLLHTEVPVPVGSIAINDDTPDFPLALMDAASDNTVLAFVQDIAAGEGGDILPDGTVLLENSNFSDHLDLYDANYAHLTTVVAVESDFVSQNKVDTFYIARFTTGVTPATVRTVSSAGVLGPTTWTLTGNIALLGIAPSPDESILYFTKSGSLAIKRWDLVNSVALTDLTTVAAGAMQKDVLCLDDGSVIVMTRGVAIQECYRYSAAGALLHTYSLNRALSSSGGDRMAYGVDDTTFWVQQKDTNQTGTVSQIRVSDGAVLTQRTYRYFEGGVYEGTPTATPDARFGPSFSCPFWITRVAYPVVVPPGSITVIKTTSPSGLPDVFDFTAGGGLSPGTFTLQDGGSQGFASVPVGSGYSIVETPDPDFSTLITVSNGSPNTNISVGSGEAVVVTVLNAQQITPGGQPGCPLGAPAVATGENGCTIPNDF